MNSTKKFNNAVLTQKDVYYFQGMNENNQINKAIVQSRASACSNFIIPLDNQLPSRIQLIFTQNNQLQYLSAVYISYEIHFDSQLHEHIEFIAKWSEKTYYNNVYKNFNIVSASGCSPFSSFSSFSEMIDFSSIQDDVSQVLFSFEVYKTQTSLIKTYLSNIAVLFYFKCPIGCAGSCPNGICQSCIAGYNLVGTLCQLQCPNGKFSLIEPTSTVQTCQTCLANCFQCSDATTCNVCNDGYTFNIVNNQVINTSCIVCFNLCKTCASNQQNSCQSCISNYYPLKNSQSQQTFECIQNCPNGYEFADQTCLLNNNKFVYNFPNKTCRTCSSQQSSTCLDCYPGMSLNNGSCKCSQDVRNLDHYYCSYENIAIIQAIFSNSDPTLTLEFGIQLNSVTIQCDEIFEASTLDLLGSSLCSINQSQVVVQLSKDAKIMVNNTISIINNSKKLQFQGSSQPIDTIQFLTIDQAPVSPQVNIKYDQVVNSCNDISYQIQNVQNDAGRGFFSIEWILDYPQSFDQNIQEKLNSVFEEANKLQRQTLIIPKFMIPPDSNITVKLSYMLKVYKSSILPFTTLNQKNKQISISSIQNKYSPIYRYMALNIQFLIFSEECGMTGQITTQDIYDIKLSSQALPSINKDLNKFSNSVLQIEIEPYSIPINTVLDFDVQVSSNQAISSKYTLSIPYSLSNLQMFIQNGANMLVDYKTDLTLNAISRDFEVQDPKSPQGLKLVWSCKTLEAVNGDDKCYTYLKKVYSLPQDMLSFTITQNTFNPYQTLNFTIVGSKDIRQVQASILVIFAEIDLPPLLVQFDDFNQINSVNINEDISATLVYGSNISSDLLTYAGAILYNNQVVGVIKFDFYKIKFRIWDYFSNLKVDNPVVQVRFTVYNPTNIMPSLSITNFNINIPPQNCVLYLNPQSGEALTTQFSFQFIGCTTTNNPLSYQFFYYNQTSDQKQEILVPQNILRRQLQDQSTINSVTTFLPSGNIVVMVQAMDSRLAVYNTTVSLNISPYQQSEQKLLDLIDQALSFQNSNLSVNTIVKNLCIIGEEIAKSNIVYSAESVNQRKVRLISAIIDQTNQLPKSSFLSTYSNKIVAALQSSLGSQQNAQSQIVLNQVSSILQNQQIQIANYDPENKIQNNNDIILQNLVDSFKILNSTTQILSEILLQLSNHNGKRNLNSLDVSLDSIRALSTQISQETLEQQMKISDQIGSLLNNITLPNQGSFQLQGNLISMTTEQITAKNLQNYMYIRNKPTKSDSSIYNVVISNYSSNPFIQTDGFQSYINQLQNSTPGIQFSLNSVIKPTIQSITGAANTPFDNSLQLEFSNIKPSKYNLTCLQQQQDSNWSQSKCSILKQSQNGAYTCFCSDQKPTTITENLEQLLDNKNLQTAFGSQGIENISNFTTFYEYAVFWILSSVTLLQIGLCCYGRKLDSKVQVSSMLTIAPASLVNIAQAEFVSQDQSPVKRKTRRSKNFLTPNQNQNESIKQNPLSQRWMQSNIQLKETQLQQLQPNKLSIKQSQITQDKQLSQKQSGNEDSNNQSFLSQCINQKENQQIAQEDQIIVENKEIKNNEIEQKKEEEQGENLNLFKQSQNTQKILKSSLLQKILIFHSFSSIFYVYDSKQSRAFRFTIFYIRVIHSLSISIIFDEQYNRQQILMLSCINSVLIIVSVTIINLIYKLRKIGKVISSLLMIGLLGLYYYIILSIISGQSQSYSNKKIYSFFIMFGVDFLVVSSIISLFSIFIFVKSAQSATKSGFILKLLDFLQIQHILLNLRL